MFTESGVGEDRVAPTGGRYNWGGPIQAVSSLDPNSTVAMRRELRRERVRDEIRQERWPDVTPAVAQVPAQRVAAARETRIEQLPDVPSMKAARAEQNRARKAMRRGARQYKRGFYVPGWLMASWLSTWVGSVLIAAAGSATFMYYLMK